jgi:hypothetical protein
MKWETMKHGNDKSIPLPGERIFMSRTGTSITNGGGDLWYQYLGDPSDLTKEDINFMTSIMPPKAPKILIDSDDLVKWRETNNSVKEKSKSNRLFRKMKKQ